MGRSTSRYVDRLAGNLLRLVRAEREMTQRDLAAAAGVPQSTIARIESGARQPSLPVLARILAAVDLELRIDLAAYDDHDDILDATEAHYTGRQQAARQAAVDEFLAGFTDVRR